VVDVAAMMPPLEERVDILCGIATTQV